MAEVKGIEGLRQLRLRHPEMTLDKTMTSSVPRRLGMSARAVSRAWKETTPGSTKDVKSIPIGEFVKKLDFATQLRDGIKEHLSDGFMLESDFRALLNIPRDKFRHLADLPEFEPNRIYHSGKWWWSSKHNIDQAKSVQALYQ